MSDSLPPLPSSLKKLLGAVTPPSPPEGAMERVLAQVHQSLAAGALSGAGAGAAGEGTGGDPGAGGSSGASGGGTGGAGSSGAGGAGGARASGVHGPQAPGGTSVGAGAGTGMAGGTSVGTATSAPTVVAGAGTTASVGAATGASTVVAGGAGGASGVAATGASAVVAGAGTTVSVGAATGASAVVAGAGTTVSVGAAATTLKVVAGAGTVAKLFGAAGLPAVVAALVVGGATGVVVDRVVRPPVAKVERGERVGAPSVAASEALPTEPTSPEPETTTPERAELAGPAEAHATIGAPRADEARTAKGAAAGARPTLRGDAQPRTLEAPASPDRALAEERHLLETARTALRRGEGKAALAPLAEHERRFGSGRLVEERESLMVQALAATEQLPQARARAARFHERFPHSLLGGVVDEAVRAP